jgi:hypothetical protein
MDEDSGRMLRGLKTDTRDQPRPEEPVELYPQTRIVCKAGGIILFSGSQLHSTVPNTAGSARFSIDFRTVHMDDVTGKKGAPNIDSACTGTTLRDFMRAADLAQMPEESVLPYDQEPPGDGVLVFRPPEATSD